MAPNSLLGSPRPPHPKLCNLPISFQPLKSWPGAQENSLTRQIHLFPVWPVPGGPGQLSACPPAEDSSQGGLGEAQVHLGTEQRSRDKLPGALQPAAVHTLTVGLRIWCPSQGGGGSRALGGGGFSASGVAPPVCSSSALTPNSDLPPWPSFTVHLRDFRSTAAPFISSEYLGHRR